MARNPIKDQVAIVGVGSTGFSRASDRTSLSLALEAATAAIRDAGPHRGRHRRRRRDGRARRAGTRGRRRRRSASTTSRTTRARAGRDVLVRRRRERGLRRARATPCSWSTRSCGCRGTSRQAANDPFRRHLQTGMAAFPESIANAAGYAAWASRYLYEYGASRDTFARIAINQRTNAAQNPLAAIQTPLTMEDYYAARMIREPLCMLDMDLPGRRRRRVRAHHRGAGPRPRRSRRCSSTRPRPGSSRRTTRTSSRASRHHGQHVVVDTLKAKSDVWIDDVDVFFPYDGFTIITAQWIENAGWCGPGEAGAFLEQHWDDASNRVAHRRPGADEPARRLAVRRAPRAAPGHLREAVVQLRGQAGERQVAERAAALGHSPAGSSSTPRARCCAPG